MRVVFVQHGESESNVSDIMDGDPTSEIPLTPKGRAQAREVGERLKHHHVDVIYVSEFTRAQQTFEEFNTKKFATIDKRLNELRSGFEGLPPQMYIDYLRAQKDPFSAKYGDGESLNEFQSRLHSFLEELKTKVFSCALVITHEACILHMLYLLGKATKEQLLELNQIQNASIHEVWL